MKGAGLVVKIYNDNETCFPELQFYEMLNAASKKVRESTCTVSLVVLYLIISRIPLSALSIALARTTVV